MVILKVPTSLGEFDCQEAVLVVEYKVIKAVDYPAVEGVTDIE
jgi:hypothetical protein